MKLKPEPWIWFNGALVPWEKAQVHVLTHALHYGTSVFEGLRAYATPSGPSILGLDAHVARLFHSCKILNMPVPYEPAHIRTAILDTVRANQHDACYIRPLVYHAYGALGVWAAETPVEVAIATFPWAKRDDDVLEKGLAVGVSSWRRMAPDTLPAMAKCGGNYVNSALIIDEAKRHGYDEGLALDVDGYVAEGSGQNLFLVQGDVVYTPPVGASILSGFTRAAVIRLARDHCIEVVEQRLPREMLHTADEAFFTGTVAEVTPIHSVDGRRVGAGVRGPITRRIQDAFFGIATGRAPDPHGWRTNVRS